MYLTHKDYQGLGFTAVPQAQFERYAARAEQTVRRHTQNRIKSMRGGGLSMLNRCGVCELIDLFYLSDNPQCEEALKRQAVVSFSNQGYSERRAGGTQGSAQDVLDVIAVYFSPDQRFRGVD